MTAQLSLLSQYRNAQARYRHAQEACPHWDYESDGCGQDCCNELAVAERAAIAARNKLED